MKTHLQIKLFLLLLFLIIFVFACHTMNSNHVLRRNPTESNLRQYACANCFYWYFKKMGYDTKDIRSVTGGIVELGYSSADKYQKISLFIKDYKPNIKTKNQIDIDLLKCFSLDESKELNELINSLK